VIYFTTTRSVLQEFAYKMGNFCSVQVREEIGLTVCISGAHNLKFRINQIIMSFMFSERTASIFFHKFA